MTKWQHFDNYYFTQKKFQHHKINMPLVTTCFYQTSWLFYSKYGNLNSSLMNVCWNVNLLSTVLGKNSERVCIYIPTATRSGATPFLHVSPVTLYCFTVYLTTSHTVEIENRKTVKTFLHGICIYRYELVL